MQIQKVRVLAHSVKKLVHRNAKANVSKLLAKVHPADIGKLLMELSPRDQIEVFSIVLREGHERAAETLSNLEVEVAVQILQQLASQEISQILQALESDDAADFIAALPEPLAEEVLQSMNVKDSEGVQELLQHEEQTAGRIMTTNVFSLNENLSVGEAIHTIQSGSDLEMVFYLYVVDERNHLVGVVSLRQLLMVPPSTPLKEVMTTSIISVTTDTDQEEVARQVALYDLLAIPVVDDQARLAGIITVDDVIDVIQEEATEDILHLAGVTTDDRIYTSRWQSFKKRIIWLCTHLILLLVAVNVIAFYEPTIASYSYLAIFLPVVAGLGGSSGTQTLTVTVRAIALGEIGWSSSRAALAKELVLGLANGLVIGTLAGILAYFWRGIPVLGIILSAAMIINMFVAGLIGTVIPLVLRKLKIDPAIASSMFLTTVTDVTGYFAFLALAVRFLRN